MDARPSKFVVDRLLNFVGVAPNAASTIAELFSKELEAEDEGSKECLSKLMREQGYTDLQATRFFTALKSVDTQRITLTSLRLGFDCSIAPQLLFWLQVIF